RKTEASSEVHYYVQTFRKELHSHRRLRPRADRLVVRIFRGIQGVARASLSRPAAVLHDFRSAASLGWLVSARWPAAGHFPGGAGLDPPHHVWCRAEGVLTSREALQRKPGHVWPLISDFF